MTITHLPRPAADAGAPPSWSEPGSSSARRPRVAFYGHDTLGLGHLRRNLALAGVVAQLPCRPDVLVVSGAAEAGRFSPVPGVDLLTVPSISKDADGGYAPSHLSAGLEEVVQLRSAVLAAALTSWSPDLLVVDKVPLGFDGELEQALTALRRRGRTRLVLGLRDVLDEPRVARAQWRQGRCSEAVRDLYDEVWVYGDPAVGDLADDCAFPPAVRARTHHVGLLSSGRLGEPQRPPGVGDQPYVLCLVGGGADGGRLAERFARTALPAGHVGVLLTGPYLPADQRDALSARAREDLVVVPFAEDAQSWVSGASAVVAMGGYNTVAEILATDAPALLVPRRRPRREQAVRAERLGARDLVDVAPEDLDAGQLGAWLDRAVTGARTDRSRLDRGGLRAVAERAGALIGAAPAGRTAGRGLRAVG